MSIKVLYLAKNFYTSPKQISVYASGQKAMKEDLLLLMLLHLIRILNQGLILHLS